MPSKDEASEKDAYSLADFTGTLVLAGAGKMGGAMLDGWLRIGLGSNNVVVFEPQPSPQLATLAARGARLNPPKDDVRDVAVVVIAVKPQIAAGVLAGMSPLVGASTIAVSIMAGQTLGFLQRNLPAGAAVVRAMPNLPASIGRGITVAVVNDCVREPQRALAHKLLAAVGAVEWVGDEHLLDAVTAVSGSGPAYVFLLAESLARAGEAAGLPADLAARLARATVEGAGELLHRSPLDPATLRQNVTSPGGTTAAALEILMGARGLDSLMKRAIAAAVRRSRDLAN